jgi:hypothetical protein
MVTKKPTLSERRKISFTPQVKTNLKIVAEEDKKDESPTRKISISAWKTE